MKRILLVCVLGLIITVSSFATSYVTDKHFSQFSATANAMAKKYGAENVLLVYDIDCTLLTAKQDIGSDMWYDWQSGLMKTDINSKYLVSKDFGQLLQYQVILNNFYPLYPTEKTLATQFNTLQKQGFKTLILTARGNAWRNVTENQFAFAKMDPSISSFDPGFPGLYKPYDLKDLKASGLTQADVAKYKLGEPRAVSFSEGMFFGSGQNKGIMLKALLNKTGKQYKAIIFIDDSKKNTDDVWNVYKNNSDVNTIVVRYSYEDAMKEAFAKKDKEPMYQKWLKFHQMMKDVFNETQLPIGA